MPETTARQAREGATLAKQAAAILRRALARNEPWKGVDEERFQPVKITAMSTATAWNLPHGSQMIWLNNGAIRTSPRQTDERRDRRAVPAVAQREGAAEGRRNARRVKSRTERAGRRRATGDAASRAGTGRGR